jgi:L-lactate utilization protein LutB
MDKATTELVERFTAGAGMLGGVVYVAGNVEDAGRYILSVAGARNAARAVITRSNLAGRMGLAELLGKAGIKVTDANAKPDAAKISPDTRQILRETYIHADISISEAVFGIAETGSYVMASDDGNDRLADLLPSAHFTLMETGKLVATLDDAILKLQQLKSVTGRSMPAFLTFITGRNITGDIPGALLARAQGPEAEHVVLVDAP